MRCQNYVFDLYGTLIDINTDEENPDNWKKLAEYFTEYGIDYSKNELKAAFRMLVEKQQMIREEIDIAETFSGLFLMKGMQPAEDMVLKTARYFRELTTEYICLYPDVKKLLYELKKQGKNLYLLTNAQRVFTVPELKKLGIYDCFDGIYISSDYGIKKPNPAFFNILLSDRGILADDCLMIGNDMTCDIMGASSVGIESLYLHTNLSPDEDMDIAGAYYKSIVEIYEKLVS